MSDHFKKKYGGSAGAILDAWGQDRINKEIGEIYEENVFGQESIPMDEILNEYYGGTTGGAIVYKSDLGEAKSKGIIQG